VRADNREADASKIVVCNSNEESAKAAEATMRRSTVRPVLRCRDVNVILLAYPVIPLQQKLLPPRKWRLDDDELEVVRMRWMW
jgi:hypothetical protein